MRSVLVSELLLDEVPGSEFPVPESASRAAQGGDAK